jgi:ABC-type transport system substrate-binding protein
MLKNKKWLVLSVLAVVALVISACTTPEEVVVTIEVEGPAGETVIVTATPAAEEAGGEEPAGGELVAFSTGIFEDMTTTNYWSYLGPDASVWNGYVLTGHPTLFGYSDQRFDWIPGVAADFPTDRTQEGDFCVITVAMMDGLTWSDGEALNADDVVFTLNTAYALQLGGNWASYTPTTLASVEKVDDLTVKYNWTVCPGLAEWEFGVAFAPIMAEHYWAPVAAEALAQIEGLEEPAAPAEDASEEEQAAYEEALAAYQEAVAAGATTLYGHAPENEPFFGPFSFAGWEPGAFAEVTAWADYPFTGTITKEYANGAYQEIRPDGSEFVAYGDASGDVTLEIETGPFVPGVIYSIYGSQDAAILAMQNGEIDYFFNPSGLQSGLRAQVEAIEGVNLISNPANGFRYMAFNTRKMPMSDVAFRQAVATMVDKNFITQTLLQGTAVPINTVVPEAVGVWYNPGVKIWGLKEDGTPMTAEERLTAAAQILRDAGYTWEGGVEPAWDPDLRSAIEPGRLIMPDGTPVQDLELLSPSAGYDPMRATAAVWIEQWCRDLGIPVTANLTGFNAIVPVVFAEGEEALNWDMYILGWGLGGPYPDHMWAFFNSANDSALGGFNTPGYASAEFDAASDAFMAATDLDTALELAYEQQEILANDVPYITLFTTPILEAFTNSVVFPYTDVLDGVQGANGLTAGVRVYE